MKDLRHIWWSRGEERGLIAIGITDDDIFRLETIHGTSITIQDFLAICKNSTDIQDWIVRGLDLNRHRKTPCALDWIPGASGCVDYILRVCKDAELRNYPIVGVWHISMYHKLNKPVQIQLMDLPIFLEQIFRDYLLEDPQDPEDNDDFMFTVFTPKERVQFTFPDIDVDSAKIFRYFNRSNPG